MTMAFIATRRVLHWLERFPTSIIQLGFRFGVGAVFFKSGLLKFNSWELAVLLFRDEYKVPVVPPDLAAMSATFFELTCPVLLFLGLGTRLATLPLLGMIVVIQTFVYPDAWADHLMWGSALVFLLVRGGGGLAADAVIARLSGLTAGAR